MDWKTISLVINLPKRCKRYQYTIMSVSEPSQRRIGVSRPWRTIFSVIFFFLTFSLVIPSGVSANKNSAAIQLNVAEDLFLNGKFARALDAIRDSTDAGHPGALFLASQILSYPANPDADETEARRLAFEAIEAGSDEAVIWLAQKFVFALDVIEDLPSLSGDIERRRPVIADAKKLLAHAKRLASRGVSDAKHATSALSAFDPFDGGVEDRVTSISNQFARNEKRYEDEPTFVGSGYAAGSALTILALATDNNRAAMLAYRYLVKDAKRGLVEAQTWAAEVYFRLNERSVWKVGRHEYHEGMFWALVAARAGNEHAAKRYEQWTRTKTPETIGQIQKDVQQAIDLESNVFGKRFAISKAWCERSLEPGKSRLSTCVSFSTNHDVQCRIALADEDRKVLVRQSQAYEACRLRLLDDTENNG